jgi:adenylate kinase
MQQLGVIPDKIIHMQVGAPVTVMRVKNNLLAANSPLYGPELDEVAMQAVEEYGLHMKGVQAAFKGFVYDYQADEKDQNEVANDLARMLRIRYKNDAPRRPPRVILLGPPGSGRSTQARIISKRFGLVHICTRSLIKAEIVKKPELAQLIAKCIKEGSLVPESVVIPLIEQRIKESDCRVNGWVLDGFPQTETQINLLKSLKIRPSLVCLFEQPEQESLRRLKNRKIDPNTGTIYDMDISPPADETVTSRLVELSEDNETVVKARMQHYNTNQHHIEEAYKDMLFTVQADQPIEQVTEVISDVILNPIF